MPGTSAGRSNAGTGLSIITDGGMGGGRLGIGIDALLRRQDGDGLTLAAEGELGARSGIIGTHSRPDRIEPIAVAGNRAALARAQYADILLLPGAAGGHAQDSNGETRIGQAHAPRGARPAREPGERGGSRQARA